MSRAAEACRGTGSESGFFRERWRIFVSLCCGDSFSHGWLCRFRGILKSFRFESPGWSFFSFFIRSAAGQGICWRRVYFVCVLF